MNKYLYLVVFFSVLTNMARAEYLVFLTCKDKNAAVFKPHFSGLALVLDNPTSEVEHPKGVFFAKMAAVNVVTLRPSTDGDQIPKDKDGQSLFPGCRKIYSFRNGEKKLGRAGSAGQICTGRMQGIQGRGAIPNPINSDFRDLLIQKHRKYRDVPGHCFDYSRLNKTPLTQS